MSIVYTADVFCDGDDCSLWTEGVSAGMPPAKSSARLTAARNAQYKNHKGKDYCPDCWREMHRPAPKEPT